MMCNHYNKQTTLKYPMLGHKLVYKWYFASFQSDCDSSCVFILINLCMFVCFLPLLLSLLVRQMKIPALMGKNIFDLFL